MATVFQSIPTDRQPGLKKKLKYIIIIIIFSFSQVQKKVQKITGLKEHF